MSEPVHQINPYKGLEPFSEEDAQFFFGRDELRKLIADNLRSFRLTIVYGPSGVGKSSVLRAGVIHHLKNLAESNRNKYGKPRLAVGRMEDWRGDPVLALTECARRATLQALGDHATDSIPAGASVAETIRICSELVGGDLLIVLDQFEQFFLRRDTENEEKFLDEFVHLVNSRRSGVNFLISIREDAYTKLDALKDDIFNLFDNSIPISSIDRDAARDAIIKPKDQYNLLTAPGGRIISIEPALVEAVLNHSVISGEDVSADGGGSASPSRPAVIKTPFLQIVMKRLWESGIERGAATLTLKMLDDLGGVEHIVHERLLSAIDNLSDEEKSVAAKVFYHLVTPSNTKVAYSISDLTAYTKCDRESLTGVLEKLAASRILWAARSAGPRHETQYEIFHDVLAEPISRWRIRRAADQENAERLAESERRAEEQRELAEEQRRRAMVRRRVAISMFALFVVASIATVIALFALRSARQLSSALSKAKERNEVVDLYNNKFISDTYELFDEPSLLVMDEMFRKQLEGFRKKSDHARIGLVCRHLAALRWRIGGIYKDGGDYANASSSFERGVADAAEGLDALKTVLGENDVYFASMLSQLAGIYYEQGNFAAAEPRLRQSLDIVSRLFGPNSEDVFVYVDNLAACNENLGRYREALQLYERALSIQENSSPLDAIKVADGRRKLGGVYLKLGSYEGAETQLNKAYDLIKSAIDRKDASPETISLFLNSLAKLRIKQGKRQEAEELLKQQQQIDTDNQRSVEVAYDKTDLGLLYVGLERYAEAKTLLTEALAKLRNALGVDSLYGTKTRRGLALVYTRQKNYAEAETLLKEALAIQEQLVGPDHPYVADTLDAYAELMRATNHEATASEMTARANRIREKGKGN